MSTYFIHFGVMKPGDDLVSCIEQCGNSTTRGLRALAEEYDAAASSCRALSNFTEANEGVSMGGGACGVHLYTPTPITDDILKELSKVVGITKFDDPDEFESEWTEEENAVLTKKLEGE